MDELLQGLRAAAERTRLRILGLCAHGELTVSDLGEILGQSQPRVSRHLKLLVEAGLLAVGGPAVVPGAVPGTRRHEHTPDPPAAHSEPPAADSHRL